MAATSWADVEMDDLVVDAVTATELDSAINESWASEVWNPPPQPLAFHRPKTEEPAGGISNDSVDSNTPGASDNPWTQVRRTKPHRNRLDAISYSSVASRQPSKSNHSNNRRKPRSIHHPPENSTAPTRRRADYTVPPTEGCDHDECQTNKTGYCVYEIRKSIYCRHESEAQGSCPYGSDCFFSHEITPH